VRYFVRAAGCIVALLGFGAAAWKTQPRDRFIGWTPSQRQQRLHRVVNNARFLILPWVECKDLASSILARAAHRIANDWQLQYGYRPVLLETFVEQPRFRGIAYQAAHWTCLGATAGRGKPMFTTAPCCPKRPSGSIPSTAISGVCCASDRDAALATRIRYCPDLLRCYRIRR